MSSFSYHTLFTCSECGQSNIYIASFAPLKPASRAGKRLSPATVTLDIRTNALTASIFAHSGGTSRTSKNHFILKATFFAPVPGIREEHLAVIESIKDVIATVKPDIVVTDVFFYRAMDACKLRITGFPIFSQMAADSPQYLTLPATPDTSADVRKARTHSGLPPVVDDITVGEEIKAGEIT